MKAYFNAANIINSFIKDNLYSVPQTSIERFMECITSSERVFLTGMGRSGLVAKSFAMRLMHLARHTYIVGDVTTPAIQEGDLLIVISGSGKTTHVLNTVEKAKQLKVKIISLTSFEDSPIAKNSDFIIKLEGKEKNTGRADYITNQLEGKYESLAPMGTLFEISAMVFLDCLIAELANRLGKTESDMKSIHANLE